MSMPLMKARTLRPVSRSTGSQNASIIGVLEEQAQIAQLLMLAEPPQVALGRGEGLLERDDEHVGAGPVRAGLRGPAPKVLLVDAHHLVGDRAERVLRRLGSIEVGRFNGHSGRVLSELVELGPDSSGDRVCGFRC